MKFVSLEAILAQAFETVKPADFMNVVEAGELYNIIKQPNVYNGPYSSDLTPYMIEPQEELTSLEFQGVVFVGPARTGKSIALLNWICYLVKIAPADLLIVHSEQHKARDWSKDDLAKFLRNSSAIRQAMIPGRKNDNIFDKEFLSGMRISLVWPTIGNLSGKTVGRHWIPDYDRIPDSVDKEGPAFDLTMKRGETHKRFSMTVAESSPGRLIENPKWIPQTPHEAPPVKGILGLYNRGDRRRWNWRCEQCDDAFEPSFALFDYPGKADKFNVPADPLEAAEQVVLICPHCGYPHTPDMKEHLNTEGRWVKDGMLWVPSEGMQVRPGMKVRRSNIASFWMKGPAAAFQTWTGMVLNYINAQKAYADTGDEEPFKKTINTDQGEPYTPKALISDRSPELLKAKAEDWGATREDPTVPPEVRVLIGTIDVQARSNAAFVTQVIGLTAGGDAIVIDSDRIIKSHRLDEDGERYRVDPAAFLEDWETIKDGMLEKTYPLSDGSGRRMGIYVVACDSGGAEGVTSNAYRFWTKLKDEGEGLHRKFILVKGGSIEKGPTTRVLWPDSNRSDRNASAKGEVPVVELNPWILKDRVSNMLLRRVRVNSEDAGGGSIRCPTWLPDWFYTQVTTEVRTAKGWENPKSRRNECWDLLYYAIGVAVRPNDEATYAPLRTVRFDKIEWDKPDKVPSWAQTWDKNDMIFSPNNERQVGEKRKVKSFKDLGGNLA